MWLLIQNPQLSSDSPVRTLEKMEHEPQSKRVSYVPTSREVRTEGQGTPIHFFWPLRFTSRAPREGSGAFVSCWCGGTWPIGEVEHTGDGPREVSSDLKQDPSSVDICGTYGILCSGVESWRKSCY